MCHACRTLLRRRGFLAAGLAGATGWAALPVRAASGPTSGVGVGEALSRLQAGNRRFVEAPQVCAAQLASSREQMAAHQAPWAAVLSCADSRVPPELVFGGLGLGELFVARNAGNQIDTNTLGTLEYGSAVLGVPLIVVLGHERCGAIAAACDVVERNAQFPGSIGSMVGTLLPAAQAVKGRTGDFVDLAVRENARQTARRIATDSPVIAPRVAAGTLRVIAARYDLDDGRVEFLE